MWSEWLRRFLFESQHFRGFIKILFAALIASDPEVGIDSRAGSDGIRLAKYNSMPEQYISPNVEPMVLAKHHPTITAIFPHRSSLQSVTSVGWAISGANERKSTGISDFNPIPSLRNNIPPPPSRVNLKSPCPRECCLEL